MITRRPPTASDCSAASSVARLATISIAASTPQALRERFDRIRQLRLARVDDFVGAVRLRECKLVVADIRGEHARAA